MDGKFTSGYRRHVSVTPREEEIIPGESILESYIPSFCFKNRKDLLFLSVFYSNISGIKGIISHNGANVNFRNNTGSTALHMAAAMGSVDVVDCLIELGAIVDAEDIKGNTPLEVALRFKKDEVVKLLMKHGAKPQAVPILIDITDMFSECEIDPTELHFGNNVNTSKEMSVQAEWLKLPVTVKKFSEDATAKADKLRAFRDEVSVLQQIRHPNIVLFFGVVARSHPMMIVTEYFPKICLATYTDPCGRQCLLFCVETFSLVIETCY